MPLNNTIYEQILEQFGFDADYTVKCIEANRHNNITAAYHLMYKKAQRQNADYLGPPSNHVTVSVDRHAAVKEQAKTVQARGTSTCVNQRNNQNMQSVNRDDARVDLQTN